MDAAQDSGDDSDPPPPPMWSNVTSLAQAPSAAGSSSGSGARASCEHVSQKVRLGKDAGAAGGSNPGRGSASAPSPSRSGTGLGRVPSNFGRSTRASSGSSTDSLGTGSKLRRAAGTVQRHWRGLRGRWKVMKRLTWLVSSGLDQMDEQLILDLGIFLEGLASGEGSLSLSERSHEAGEDVEAGGRSAPSGGGGNQAQSFVRMDDELTARTDSFRHLRSAAASTAFPLSERATHDLVASLCQSRLYPIAFVHDLLERQREIFRAMPNISRYTVPPGGTICIVGDIHGQYADLMHIFRSHGFPSAKRAYLFNGDFVDRGDCGVEVCLTLFAFQQLFPGTVFLNRGNHEERSVHAMYGFQRECTRKYSAATYDLFNQVFEWLPLATIINDEVFVVHGGVDDGVSVDNLNDVPRNEYVVNAMPSKPGLIHPLMAARMAEIKKRDALLKPINSALWNDPMVIEGVLPNKTRGTGQFFGADVCQNFLTRCGLSLVLRSHEQVEGGFEWPYAPRQTLATIFSASNYAGRSINKGAFALLGAAGEDWGGPLRAPTASEAEEGAAVKFGFGCLRFVQFEADHIHELRVQQRNLHRIHTLIVEQRVALEEAYTGADKAGSGSLPVATWTQLTTSCLGLPFPLEAHMRSLLVGPEAATEPINFRAFLARFAIVRPELEPIFPLREYLFALMFKADTAAKGVISLRELNGVCLVMRNFFTERAALCASTAELLRALGDVGDAAQKSGYLNIMQAIELFRVVVSAPDGTSHTSLVELLHRLERDEMIEATFGERPKAAENARDASVLAPSAPSSRHLSIATGVFPNVASGDVAFAPVVGGRDASSSRLVSRELGDAESDDEESKGDFGGINAG